MRFGVGITARWRGGPANAIVTASAHWSTHRYAPEIWDPVYNWTSRKDGVFRQVNRRTELHLLDDDDAEAMCDRVYSTTKPWSCAWGDATDGLGAAPMRWADRNGNGGSPPTILPTGAINHRTTSCRLDPPARQLQGGHDAGAVRRFRHG